MECAFASNPQCCVSLQNFPRSAIVRAVLACHRSPARRRTELVFVPQADGGAGPLGAGGGHEAGGDVVVEAALARAAAAASAAAYGQARQNERRHRCENDADQQPHVVCRPGARGLAARMQLFPSQHFTAPRPC